MKLIDATSNDLQLINDLMRRSKAYWNYDADFMDKFMSIFQVTKDYLKQNKVKLFFGSELDYNPNTTLIGFYSYSQNGKECLEVDNFFIDPNHIGKGYGKKMWFFLLDNLKVLNEKSFTLWSDPYAEAFYQKMGCEKIGVKKSPMMPDRYPVIFKYTL